MKEQTLIDLKFIKQSETPESSGSDRDWHYYTLDIGDITFISCDDDVAKKEGGEWNVQIFDFQSMEVNSADDLTNIIKNNTI